MHWVRSHVRLGSRLALFALAVQIVLSFGHVHVDHAASAGTNALLTGISAQPTADSSGPAKPNKPHGLADDFCAICSVLQMVASAAPVSAPHLSIPVVTRQAWLTTDVQGELAASPHLLFHARAPPQA